MDAEHLVAARDYVGTKTGSQLFPSIDALHHFARLHASELGSSICTHRGRHTSTLPGSSGRLRTSSRRKSERDKSAHQQKGLKAQTAWGLL